MFDDKIYFYELKEKYEKNLLQNRIIVLSGEVGLGQDYTLQNFVDFAEKNAVICIDLSYYPGDIPLFSIWTTLEKYLDINALYLNNLDSNYHLTYLEFLFSIIMKLCKEEKKILFYSKNILKNNNDITCFMEKIWEYILPYFDTVFLCCHYIDEKDNTDITYLLSHYCYYINNIPFSRWKINDLKEYFYNTFNNKIRIEAHDLEQILSSALGNPHRLRDIIDYLISEAIIIKEQDLYICSNLDEKILFNKTKEYIINRFNRLNKELQTIVKGSSVLGMEFHSQLLQTPLNLKNVDSYLCEIERRSHLIYKKVDSSYCFYNKETYLSIKSIISSEEYNTWCMLLAQYYYLEAEKNILKKNNVASCNLYLSSAYYYAEILEYEASAIIYYKTVILMISFMQYEHALLIIKQLEDANGKLYTVLPNVLRENLIILKASCLFSTFNFREAATEYKKFMVSPNISTLEYQKIYCQYAICLYNIGQTAQSYQILIQLYEEIPNKEPTIENVELLVNILSNLSSIEETLQLRDCTCHFNLALQYAHKYKLTDIYYSLLRKSFIVHSGINYMQMLEVAKIYYKENGVKKDYAMVIHNLASFHLLYGDMDNVKTNCLEAIKIFQEIGSDGIHYTYNCMGMYYCMLGDFLKALKYLRLAFKKRYEAFSQIVILLNQITTHIKIGNHLCANQIMKYIESLWLYDEAETLRILKPYHYIIKANLLEKLENNQEAYKNYLNYFECEDERDSYRFIFASNKFYKLCCNSNFTFPTELKPYLKSDNETATRLINLDILPVHLMFAE